MKITLSADRYNALLANAPKFDVRHYLLGIYFDTANNCAVATDGHSLLRVPFEANDDDDKPAPFILPRTGAALKGGSVVVDTAAHTVSFLTAKDDVKRIEPYTEIDGKYPDYEKQIPSGELQDSFQLVCVNPELIARTARLLNEGFGVLLQATSDDGKHVFVVSMPKASDVTLLVMPCRP